MDKKSLAQINKGTFKFSKAPIKSGADSPSKKKLIAMANKMGKKGQ